MKESPAIILLKPVFYLLMLLPFSSAFGQYDSLLDKGMPIEISTSTGYPMNFNKSVEKMILDSFPVTDKDRSSIQFRCALLFNRNWQYSASMNFNFFGFSTDENYVELNQYHVAFGLTYQLHLGKRFSFSNELNIGITQLKQRLTNNYSAGDIFESYKTGKQIVYEKYSQPGCLVGYYSRFNWHFGKRFTLYADFLCSFNRSKKLTLNDQPVFNQVLTPGLGFSFKFLIPRSYNTMDWRELK